MQLDVKTKITRVYIQKRTKQHLVDSMTTYGYLHDEPSTKNNIMLKKILYS